MSKTQAERVIDYIEEWGSITQLEALRDLGVMRLASRISDLKKKGYPIKSEMETVHNRYGEPCYIKRYSLAAPVEHKPIKVKVKVVHTNG